MKGYMQVTEAAKYLGVTANTLRNWEKAGQIKVYRFIINKYRFYKKEDLDQFMETRMTPIE